MKVGDSQSTPSVVIRHLGLIPDGARRWADSHQVSLDTAYSKTMEMVARYINVFFNFGVSSLSIYLASSDNIEMRGSNETESFINAERALVDYMLPPLATKWSFRPSIIGKASSVTNAFRVAVERFTPPQEELAHRFLYLLIDYDPMAELQSAIRNSNNRPVTLSDFCVPDYVDAIIRTGGEQRLSNFLPLQSGYAEFHFLPKLFLDTDEQDMLRAYQDLMSRSRRLGI